MRSSVRKSLLFILGLAVLLAIAVVGLEILKKGDTENWKGTAMYGVKAAKDFADPDKEKPTQSLQEMRDFAFERKKEPKPPKE